MKTLLFVFVFLFSSFLSFSQKDQITEMLDSLENLYFYKDVKIDSSTSGKYEPGFVPEFDVAIYQNRFASMAKNSPFNYVYNSTVRSYIDRYTRNPKSAATILALGKLYFPLYEKYLNHYNIPLELKYLSIVESALNPTAKSQCGASGLWQFMYGTGRVYNLEINSYVDERFDPEKETIAACRYLKDLYSIYNDWSLAIAAYNCGPGNVNKAMKRSGKKDFWDIKEYLPKETQNYVPAFIAVSYIMTYHEEHNMSIANIKYLYEDLDSITINKKTSLSNVSYLLNIPLKELKYLNPKYFAGVIPGNNDVVIVSKDKALEWIDYENKYLTNDNNSVSIQTEDRITKKRVLNFVPISDTPNSKNEKKELDPFGTVLNDTKSYEIVPSDTIIHIANDSSEDLPESPVFVCEIYGNQTVGNNGTILIRNTEIINIDEDTYIPINSVIKGRVIFKDNSIFIKTLSAKTIYGEVRFVSETEIREKVEKKQIEIEDGYTVLLKY